MARGAAEYRQDAATLDEFRGLLAEFAALHDVSHDFLGRTFRRTRPGREEGAAALRSQLQQIAGVAAGAWDRSGMTLLYRGPFSGERLFVNLVAMWGNAFGDPTNPIPLDTILHSYDQAIDRLRQMAEAEAVAEATVTHRLGSVVGWPHRVREVTGRPRRPHAPSPAYVGGFLSGIMATVAASVILRLVFG